MKDKYLIPSAIVVTGVIVALAVIYSFGPRVEQAGQPKNNNNNTNVAQENRLSKDNLISSAVAVGVDKNDFESCINSRTYRQAVSDDLADAANSGGRGTPYSVVLNENREAFPIEGGALPYTQVKSFIVQVLAGGRTSNPQVGQNMKPVSAEDHILGDINAPIIIVEFSDLECPFCQRFHPTLKQIFEDYNGQVAWVYRHFPLESIHPDARPAAEASECVAELRGNGAFWQYLDLLFEA